MKHLKHLAVILAVGLLVTAWFFRGRSSDLSTSPVSAIGATVSGKCQAAKLKATGTFTAGLLRCHAAAANSGSVVDQTCTTKVIQKFADSFSAAEFNGHCTTTMDASSTQMSVESFVNALVAQLHPSSAPSLCAAAQLKAAASDVANLLKAYAKSRLNPNSAKVAATVAKSQGELSTSLAKAELRADCYASSVGSTLTSAITSFVGDRVESLWPLASTGVTFVHPSGYTLNAAPLAANGTISVDNFASQHDEGGLIPGGGDEIVVSKIPLPAGPLTDVIAADLDGATIDATDSVTVAGQPGTRVFYTTPFAPSVSYKNVVVYVPHNGLLYEFFLSYNSTDQSEAQFLADFQQTLDSAQFTP